MQGKLFPCTGKVVIDMQAREWCKLPYHGHPRGCPNFGRRAICPPQAPLVTDFLDLERDTWLMVAAYELRAHMDRLASLSQIPPSEELLAMKICVECDELNFVFGPA